VAELFMSQRIAVFDLDGTLVDTAADLTASLVHALAACGHAAPPAGMLRNHAGTGGRGMIAHWAAVSGKTFDEAAIQRVLGVFLAHYESAMPGVSRPYPGSMELVESLRSAGWRTAICTNKPQHLAEKLMGKLNLADRFDAICGADFFDVRKPDPRHLTGTISLAGGNSEWAVMLGDSETDIRVAQNAAVPVIAFDFGYSPEPVSTFAPTLIASSWADVSADLLEDLLARRPSA
jgi:phosphoglycolate phosphatase